MSVSLEKGQHIPLEKDTGDPLTQLCVGVNWGAMDKKGFFGGEKKVAVDLDASCAVFDANKNPIEVIFFGNLVGQGIQHTGDDQTGNLDGDDGLDNEVIRVDLDSVSTKAEQIVFMLNSFRGQDFKDIPLASIRLYEGTADRVNTIFAQYDIANDPQFAGSVSMILGKLLKQQGKWTFTAMGEITSDRKLEQTIQTVQRTFL